MKTIIKNKIVNRIIMSALVIMSILYIFDLISEHDSFTCYGSFNFINPRFACTEEQVLDKTDYSVFRDKLVEYINSKYESKDAELIGIFFRDLEAGPTLGINDRVDFIPASLLKLPNILALMRTSEEENLNVLESVTSFQGDYANYYQVYNPEKRVEPYTDYRIIDLIEYSLVYSDNLADELIARKIESLYPNRNIILEVYRDLGILAPEDPLSSAIVTTKIYSSIFRLLYNSSFLNSDSSEKMLEMLSRSSFDKGLRAGVPDNIVIAHKFGERFLSNGEKHLHDCGIIYYPDNPYSLCVMTRGSEFKKLAEIIADISRMFYEEVENRRIDG